MTQRLQSRLSSHLFIALTLTAAGAGCVPSFVPFIGKKDKPSGGAKVAPGSNSSVALSATGASKQLARVTTDDQSDEASPRLSGDGAWLLYVASGDDFHRIVKSKPDGKNAVILTAEDGQAYAPSWLPNGSSYLAVSHAMGSADVVRALRLTPRSPVARVLSAREVPSLSALAVAADGGRIAFANDVAGQATIGTAKLDGTDLTYLTEGEEPAWSPDGRHIAFQRMIAGYRQLLLTDAASGEEMTQLTDGQANSYHPAFSPDGQYVAYVSDTGSPDSPHVFAMRVDGTGVVQLTQGTAAASTPWWGQDGWIYFSADQSGTKDVWRVLPDQAALRSGK